jgi:hypothetical protein
MPGPRSSKSESLQRATLNRVQSNLLTELMGTASRIGANHEPSRGLEHRNSPNDAHPCRRLPLRTPTGTASGRNADDLGPVDTVGPCELIGAATAGRCG